MVGLEIRGRTLAGDHQHVQVTGTVTLHHVVLRVIYGDTVHYEIVSVYLRRREIDGDGPYSVLLLHGDSSLQPVAGELDDGGVVGGEAEGHLTVSYLGRDDLLAASEIEIAEFLGGKRPGHEQGRGENC